MSDYIDILYIKWESIIKRLLVYLWNTEGLGVGVINNGNENELYRLKKTISRMFWSRKLILLTSRKRRCIVASWWIINGYEDNWLFCTYLNFLGSVSHWSFDHRQYHMAFFDSNKLLYPIAVHSILTLSDEFCLTIFVTSAV